MPRGDRGSSTDIVTVTVTGGDHEESRSRSRTHETRSKVSKNLLAECKIKGLKGSQSMGRGSMDCG